MKKTEVKKETKEFSAAVGRALRRAAKVARKTARMHGTPIYRHGILETWNLGNAIKCVARPRQRVGPI
jgi:hypothetical protein